MFPCPTCASSAATQLNNMVNYIKTNCPTYWDGWVWLDIEGSQYWTGSSASNKTWYQNLVNACESNANVVQCGVYTSKV